MSGKAKSKHERPPLPVQIRVGARVRVAVSAWHERVRVARRLVRRHSGPGCPASFGGNFEGTVARGAVAPRGETFSQLEKTKKQNHGAEHGVRGFARVHCVVRCWSRVHRGAWWIMFCFASEAAGVKPRRRALKAPLPSFPDPATANPNAIACRQPVTPQAARLRSSTKSVGGGNCSPDF